MLLWTKMLLDNIGMFPMQQLQSPHVDTWGFSHCIQVRSPYVLLQIVFKVKFTTKKLMDPTLYPYHSSKARGVGAYIETIFRSRLAQLVLDTATLQPARGAVPVTILCVQNIHSYIIGLLAT